MLRVNPKMLEAFRPYIGHTNRIHPVAPSVLAHRIAFAEAKDKMIEINYFDAGDKARVMLLAGRDSLKTIMATHGSGFVQISRNYIVNLEALEAVFPTSDTSYGCSVKGFPGVLPISNRSVKAVRSAFEGRK